MGDLGCRSTRERIAMEDGTVRQVRGYYLNADIRAAAEPATAGVDAEVLDDDQ